MIDRDALRDAGQEHLVDAIERLRGQARERLAAEVADLDLDLVARLIRTVANADAPGDLDDLEPPDVVALPVDDADRAREDAAALTGEEHLRAGRVAAVLLAGGQGTRLGYDGPKGEFPFSPVTHTTLFAHHAARIAALRRRYACALPWFIMTSPQNDARTRAFFAANDWFGLPEASVRIFQQGVLPAVDSATGRILLEAPDRLALSPDGHGGIFPALIRSGALDEMAEQGVTTFLTYNVDNPVGRIGRPNFLGHHIASGSDMSNIVVRKRHPQERVGVVARSGDRTVLVEYSDLPAHLAEAVDTAGDLVFWAGSIASHAIECDFARRITDGLPYHRAHKRVPHVDATGRIIDPPEPNAIKFEAFMFDALPLAGRALSVESPRADEFSPIKNAEGDDSPQTTRRDLNRLYARWLRAAGIEISVSDEGDPPVNIEIHPSFALDADELKERLPDDFAPEPGEPIVLR